MKNIYRNKHGQFQSREQHDRTINRKIIIVLATVLLYCAFINVFAVSQWTIVREVEAHEKEQAEQSEEPALPTPLDVALAKIPHKSEETARRIAYLYEHAPTAEMADVLAKTAYCESMWTNVQSLVQQDYGQEKSYGIFQISVLHNDVTVEQALDPYYSIRWAIEHYDTTTWYGYDREADRCTNGLLEYWL